MWSELAVESMQITDAHFTTVPNSFERPAKLGKNLSTLAPALSFFLSKSHLLRKRIKEAFDSSLDEQICRQRMNESSSLFTLESSANRSSKQEIAEWKAISVIIQSGEPSTYERLHQQRMREISVQISARVTWHVRKMIACTSSK